MKAIIVYVQNDEAEKKLRQLKEAGDIAANDASEASYDLMRAKASAIITNNGTIDALHTQVHQVAKEFLGDWATWGKEPATV
jgi:dephospho-CoA kinase